MSRISLPRATPCDDPRGPKYEGQYAAEPAVDTGHVVVVTYNIRKGQAIQKAGEAFQRAERLREVDVILLQEMEETGVERLARWLRANYVYYPAFTRRNGRNAGNAILTCWPLVDARKVILPRRHPVTGQLRIAVRATVDIGESSITVYCVHTETYSTLASHRSAQVAAIVDDIGPGDSPVIVAGDFNSVSRRSVRRIEEQFAAVGLVRASADAGPTITKLRFRSSVDHVFARALDPIASGTVGDADASDHVPLWVQFAALA
jgi:endonuclease/exonuclease/phosphatase family metal-dependent hydrolase